MKLAPQFIQSPIRNIYGSLPDKIKYGKLFNETYDFLQQSQWWSKKKHEEYQIKELKRLINHAYENVPYYFKVFNERGIKPKDIQNFNDFKMLPYLTKEIIQNNLKDLVARNYNKKELLQATTGGTTGVPMGFYENKKTSKVVEYAFMTSQWARLGYNISKRNKCVILRGNLVENGYYLQKGDDLVLSSFKMSENNMEQYVELIEKFNPDFIQAYPSSISILSNYILSSNKNVNIKSLKAVLCGSENLYDFQRTKIEKAFHARTYSWYGHSEKSCLAGECNESSFYHIFSEYGYCEIINSQGVEASKENEIGELVCTGFNNYVMPFIRYKTCDIVSNTVSSCKCGRNYKLIKKIRGREQEVFVAKSGTLITFTCSDDPLWSIKDKILAYQYIQNEPGEVALCIEAKKEFLDSDMQIVKSEFFKYYPTLNIKIQIIDKIKRNSNGKFKYLIQNLPVGFGDYFKLEELVNE